MNAFELGYDELHRNGGDLQAALRQQDLRAEVVCAWLDAAIQVEPGRASELVQFVAAALDEIVMH